MIHNSDYYVVIMAGGIGSRFWPQSRIQRPKQFLDILGTGKTLIQSTFERFTNIVPPQNIYIITGQNYVNLVQEQLPQIAPSQIIAEPARKNTAPCVAYMAYKIAAKNPNASFVVAPSDHLIMHEHTFTKVINYALDFASNNPNLLTLGIEPNRPHTGYGYINFDKNASPKKGIFNVKRFTEKPSLTLAETFLNSGDYLWNSGIFVWKAQTIIQAFEQYQPVIAQLFNTSDAPYNTPAETSFIAQQYPICPSISIDYAIMEHANNVCVIPADFGWSDLGNWSSLWEQSTKDEQQNALNGQKIKLYDSSNCLVQTVDDKLIIVQGLDDYCVVNTKDVLLICKKVDEQKVKQMNADVKKIYGNDYA